MSITPSEISRTAARVHSLSEEVRRESKAIHNQIVKVDQYWKGDASKAFEQEGQVLQRQFGQQERYMESLIQELRELSHTVRRAEDEREEEKRKEAAKLAAAAAKKGK